MKKGALDLVVHKATFIIFLNATTPITFKDLYDILLYLILLKEFLHLSCCAIRSISIPSNSLRTRTWHHLHLLRSVLIQSVCVNTSIFTTLLAARTHSRRLEMDIIPQCNVEAYILWELAIITNPSWYIHEYVLYWLVKKLANTI